MEGRELRARTENDKRTSAGFCDIFETIFAVLERKNRPPPFVGRAANLRALSQVYLLVEREVARMLEFT